MYLFYYTDLLTHNTTFGLYRKLGRLYGSCLRQSINSSTIRYYLEYLGGYLPTHVVGPSTISPLISQMNQIGPTPLITVSYDLSYGKQPQVMLIIDGSTESAPVLQNAVRWKGPKAPPYRIRDDVPPLLNQLVENFLPSGLPADQRKSEKEAIVSFVKELNQVHIQFD